MTTFFGGLPGRVARIDGTAAQCSYYSPNDLAINFSQHRSIVTSIGAAHSVSNQVLNSFGDSVYVYIFGDNLSQVRISGISFCGCNTGDDHGVAAMLDWWQGLKASARNGPITFGIGTRTLRGIMVGFTQETLDLEQNLASWSADLRAIRTKP